MAANTTSALIYRDSEGNETPLAGLAPVGSLVPSTSLVQSGSVSVPDIIAQAETGIQVTFDTPMPDGDYEVFTEESSNSWGRVISIVTKSASGFSMRLLNCSSTTMTASTVKWTAVKPITATQITLDEGQIAQNTEDIAELKSTVNAVFSDYSANNNVMTYTMSNGHYECRCYYYGGLCGVYGLVMNQFGGNGGRISTIWKSTAFQYYSISVDQSTGVVSMAGTGADNVEFVITKLP